MAEVELRIAPSTALVRTARQVAVTIARRAGLDDEALEEVRLAVGEACGLAVAVAAREAGGVVTLRYEDDDGLAVRVLAPGAMSVATGGGAAQVLTDAAGDGVGEDPLPPGSVLAVLEAVVPVVDVSTGPTGLSMCLHWPAAA